VSRVIKAGGLGMSEAEARSSAESEVHTLLA
jgi:hypothetical protein